MGRFLLTPAARRDLSEIGRFIQAQNRPLTAKRIGAQLRKAARKLADMPGMGHTRDDVADESLRFWPVYSFVIA